MNVNNAELVISAVSEKQYPESDKPEVVLLGRSNVGKSSFINTLINRKGLARTSSQPGKTQTMNFYAIEGKKDKDGEMEALTFVDMPGYGYAKASKKDRAKWGAMIETYLQRRDNIRLVLLLVDSRHGPTEDDRLMFDWLEYYNIHPIVIATKADKLGKNQLAKMKKQIMNDLNLNDPNRLILFSSADKRGKDEAWEIIEEQL